jgi:nitric oxide reductase NorD protein
LHPSPPLVAADRSARDDPDDDEDDSSHSEQVETEKRRRGERVDNPDGRSGLLAFRLESLFTRAEYVSVDRTTEEDEDQKAKAAIEDLDVLSMARDGKRTAARLRFDLDLPPQENDDVYLGEGIPLPEWDFRQQTLLPDHCRLQPMLARDAGTAALPEHLRARARRLRSLFEMLKPRRIWLNAQPDGSELDINAVIDHTTDRMRGIRAAEADMFRSFQNAERDLSCLLLADLSLSTDSHVNNEQRVIDVIRDSLFLFSEALSGTGDRFGLYGFSSRRRNHVRFHTLKAFDEACSPDVMGRIQAIKPGYYTRMGAAIRYSAQLLQKEPSSQKLLLILTDGKPNDLDKYEGRYGIEDTRAAIREAGKQGIQPFCVTIDEKARDYLPYLFGSASYMLVRNAGELPAKLPLLYARLTG